MKVLWIVSLFFLWLPNIEGAEEKSDLKQEVGDVDKKTGKLIIAIFNEAKSGDPIPVLLDHDFGFLIFNDGDRFNPVFRLVVACRDSGKIYTAKSWEQAEEILKNVPENSEVFRYSRCSSGTSYGLKEATWARLETAFKNRRLTEGEIQITCNCPGMRGVDQKEMDRRIQRMLNGKK